MQIGAEREIKHGNADRSAAEDANQVRERHSSGIIRISAIIRGSTRNSSGETPIVVSASISCVTFIVPSSAANAAPVRPDMMIAVIIAPISRTKPIPTRSAT